MRIVLPCLTQTPSPASKTTLTHIIVKYGHCIRVVVGVAHAVGQLGALCRELIAADAATPVVAVDGSASSRSQHEQNNNTKPKTQYSLQADSVLEVVMHACACRHPPGCWIARQLWLPDTHKPRAAVCTPYVRDMASC
jgi:hypothetical protein